MTGQRRRVQPTNLGRLGFTRDCIMKCFVSISGGLLHSRGVLESRYGRGD